MVALDTDVAKAENKDAANAAWRRLSRRQQIIGDL